jgi:type II secretory pathway component GspD/PulD (secretin)
LIDIDRRAQAAANHSYIFRRPGMNKPRADAKPAAEQAPKQKIDERLELRVYRLKHANAVEIAQEINQLMQTGRPDSLRVVADQYTNQLLLKGQSQVLVDVEALLQRLELPAEAEAPRPGPGKKGGPSPSKRGSDNEPR